MSSKSKLANEGKGISCPIAKVNLQKETLCRDLSIGETKQAFDGGPRFNMEQQMRTNLTQNG